MKNSFKKIASLLTISFLFFACSVDQDRTINPQTVKAQGGVDVGNMSSSAAIPLTNATITFPKKWEAISSDDILTLSNGSSSTIKASRGYFEDLVVSTQLGLKKYLENKYPNRLYELYETNGLLGVRSEFEVSETSKHVDIFLMSETQEIIHINGDLNKSNNGFFEGDKIVSTVRIKYQGSPFEAAAKKTVTLENGIDYSFYGDCFGSQPNCSGVVVRYGFGKSKKGLIVGVGRGFQRGRIIQLGSENEVPFESVKVDGEFLISPKTKVSIADIYTTFTPETPNVEQRFLDLKDNHVYLIRTIGWPSDDMVVKLKVNNADERKASITYEKLVAVKPEALQKQIDSINQNTIKNEMSLESGEITLYNHAIFRNIVYSSFNFQYSTILNRFITNDSHDFIVGNACDKKPTLIPAAIAGSIADIIPFNNKNIDLISRADFPEASSKGTIGGDTCDGLIEIGKTYGFVHHRSGKAPAAVFGAIQVIDFDKNGAWARLKFRRISVEKPHHFQAWTPHPQFFENAKVQISIEKNFCFHDPFECKIYEFISMKTAQGADKLLINACMYENDCGFFNFGNKVDLNSLTIKDLENKKGRFQTSTNFSSGDVIGVYSENYYSKVLLVFKVGDYFAGKSISADIRYLKTERSGISVSFN